MPDVPIDQRWYAPLVKPVLPAVSSALKQLQPVEDPWRMPRAGLGGAVAIHIARGFGVRPWHRAGRAAVVALEGYNQRIHLGGLHSDERTSYLAQQERIALIAFVVSAPIAYGAFWYAGVFDEFKETKFKSAGGLGKDVPPIVEEIRRVKQRERGADGGGDLEPS